MNINIEIGRDSDGNFVHIDFSRHHFMLLTGATGTGKSIFHNNLYKQLVKNNTPQEIGFIFLDMTRVDFCGWESPFILRCEVKTEESIEILEALAEAKTDSSIHKFIQIEECNMFANYPERTESAVKSILKHRKDITLIYSTSRPGGNALPESLLAEADVKVVFEISGDVYVKNVLGNDVDYMPMMWEKIIDINSTRVLLQPYSEAETESLRDFKLG